MMTAKESKMTGTGESVSMETHQVKRVSGQSIYDWALYELSTARRVELSSGVDTSDLRQQIVVALQKDLYEWLGDDLTI